MNTKEIKKRINFDNFQNLYGCYVNAGEVVSYMTISILDMTDEEKELYGKLFKKILSGKPEKNLLDIELRDNDAQKCLYGLSSSRLNNSELRNGLFDQIIRNLDIDKNYCILLISDTIDSEETEFTYFMCAICPTKDSKAELKYTNKEFRGNSTGSVLSAPILGFTYPEYIDGGTDIYLSLYYFRKEPHEELIEGIFCVDPPKTADIKKKEFQSALQESLKEDYDLGTAAAIYSNIIVADENEMSFGIDEVTEILKNKNISDEKIEAVQDSLGIDYECDPEVLLDKKYEISTAEAVITVEPESALRVKIKEIDGHKYVIVPATGDVRVNGVRVLD